MTRLIRLRNTNLRRILVLTGSVNGRIGVFEDVGGEVAMVGVGLRAPWWTR